jgi:hypothetical protein
MTPKSQNLRVRSVTEASIAKQRLLKCFAVAMNTHTAGEELLGSVFPNQSYIKLYKEKQQGLELEHQ